MKKGKRIIAVIGIILLVGMYASTLIFALIDRSASMSLFKASVACTILVPVLIYAYTLVFKLLKDKNKDD